LAGLNVISPAVTGPLILTAASPVSAMNVSASPRLPA